MVDELKVAWDEAPVPAGPQRVVVWLNGHGIVGDLDVRVCHACRTGVVEHVRIDTSFRRRGLGCAALCEVVSGLADYGWTTTAIEPAAAGFWDRQDRIPAAGLGAARYCDHMHEAESLNGCE
ncbi:hypothetical protein MOQ72_43570 [Saccharopolyspora sp. K220]|uniref:hypothetical protein n=1 Tax=Saccharopolyspora soli TaxID=2926618 RepID=UPI001F5AC592|nr:hypothetical protein [Saccharopolyspora soli]MCI2424294.1 hypothetical protein [Saccharopolyspora soli]